MVGGMATSCGDKVIIVLICQDPSHAISRQYHVTTITYLLLRNAYALLVLFGYVNGLPTLLQIVFSSQSTWHPL